MDMIVLPACLDVIASPACLPAVLGHVIARPACPPPLPAAERAYLDGRTPGDNVLPTRADVSLWHRIGTVAAVLLNYGLARYAFEQVGLHLHPSALTASVWPGRLFVCQHSAPALSPFSTKGPFPAPFKATFHPHLHMNARA